MRSSVEILHKLNKENFELLSKIRNLENFIFSEEWKELSVSQKCLLDIQLQSMRTYKECLSARISDILCEDINETK